MVIFCRQSGIEGRAVVTELRTQTFYKTYPQAVLAWEGGEGVEVNEVL